MPMFGAPRIIGLDIGDASIEAAFVDLTGKQPVWLARARAELPPGLIERGIIRDAKAVSEIIRGMLAAAAPRPITVREAVVNVPDQQSVSRLLSVSGTPSREKIMALVAEDAEGFVPYPFEDVRLDFAPSGAAGKKADIFYAAAPETVLKNIESAVTAAGLNVVGFDLETLALARLFAEPPAEGAHLILDVGTEISTLSIVDAAGLRRSAVVDFGGAHLARALAEKEQISPDKAEALKRKAGFSPDAAGGRIFFVLQKETQKLIAEVRRSVDEYQRAVGTTVTQLTVAGGTALTPFMPEYLGGALGIPARLGDPVSLGVVGVPEAVSRTDAVLFANALGLSLGQRDSTFPRLSFQRKDRIMKPQPAALGGRAEGDGRPASDTGTKKPGFSKRTRVLIAIGVSLALIAGAAGAAYWAFIVRPAQQGAESGLAETLTPSFDAKLGFDPAALPEGSVAATLLTSQEKVSVAVVVSGAQEIPELASGTVTLVNDSDTAQALVARTRLVSADGIVFRLRADANVPANGRADAAVIADQPGAAGNVAAGRFTIPGLPPARQAEVYAQSDAAMTGGVRMAGSISDADVQRALATAREKASVQAVAAWREQLAPGAILVAEPLAVRIASSALPEPGEVSIPPNVELTVTVVGASVAEEALRSFADAAVVAETASDAAADAYAYSAWQIVVSDYDEASKTATATVRFNAQRS